jgi:hypothetical protein
MYGSVDFVAGSFQADPRRGSHTFTFKEVQTMSWRDREYKRQDEMVFPFIQWVNDGGSLEPRNGVGGFAMPLDQAAILGSNIPGDVRALHHKGGKQTDVVFGTALEAAVLATRFTWIKDREVIPAYEPGARGKLQALALVRDAGGHTVGPVLLTFKGVAGKQFGAALRTHREEVRKATENAAPAYAFFGVYRSGEVEMVGKETKSPITGLVYGDEFRPCDPDADYVGDAPLDALDWGQVDAWADAWNQPGGADGNGGGESNGNGRGRGASRAETPASKPQHTSPSAPDAPASHQQMDEIHGLLRQLNYDDARHGAVIRKAGHDPDNLGTEQAVQLISRLKQAAAKRSS